MNFRQLAKMTLDEACAAHVPAPVEPDAECDASLSAAAVIGFAGNDIRGRIGVAANALGQERVANHFGVPVDEVTPCDTLGKIANFVVGDLKRAWESRGVAIHIAPPQLVRGVSMEFSSKGRDEFFVQEITVGTDRLVVWLDVDAGAMVSVADEATIVDAIAPGETILV